MIDTTISCPVKVIEAAPSERALFVRRTYAHLAGAVALFVVLESMLLKSAFAEAMLSFISANRYGWLMVLGAFVLSGWLARSMAQSISSVAAQYAGLGLYVLAESVIFLPMLYIAVHYSSPEVLPNAALLTAFMFSGLTAVAFTTKKDFSFLGSALTVGGFVALGLIVASVVFGFSLGLLFSVGMVALACAAILYDTSKILNSYSTSQHVAASLELFASVALLFWYVLRIMMRISRR